MIVWEFKDAGVVVSNHNEFDILITYNIACLVQCPVFNLTVIDYVLHYISMVSLQSPPLPLILL